MKELHIIVKIPGNGDPLNMREETTLVQGGRMASIGYKFVHEDDKLYGDYILVPRKLDREQLESAMHFVTGMAFAAEDELFKKEQGYYDDYGAVDAPPETENGGT
ncbi:MAG: hypothetical protein IJV40_03640 [Oscillospiraceae bacterium]|nr:hypothetical protein [Oscillospiraceae bacterium]